MQYFRLLFDRSLVVNRAQWQVTFIAYACLCLSAAWYAAEIARGDIAWKAGDWLINYQGGLIRRGLIGELIWMIGQTGINPVWLLFALQTGIYAAILHISLRLFFSRERQVSWLALLFSPIFVVVFPLYTSDGSFRKEILAVLAFALLLVARRGEAWRPAWVAASLAAYALAAFSHETAVFVLPFFLWVLCREAIESRPWRFPPWRWPAAFVLVAALALLLALLRPGDLQAAQAICESLLSQGIHPDICTGAVEQLSQDLHYATGSVVEIGSLNNYWLLYPAVAVLALLPIAGTDWMRRRAGVLLVSMLAIAPLFVLAIDWGRWLHLYFSLAILLLLRESVDTPVSMIAIPPWIVVAYTTLWSAPLCCINKMPMGVFQYARRSLRWLMDQV